MVKYQFNPIHGASGDKLSIIYYFTETIFIYFFNSPLHTKSAWVKKNLHPAATPSLPLTTASQTDQRNTAKKKKCDRFRRKQDVFIKEVKYH